ncbi:MAG: biotin/lipoyl-containing protein [Tissierellia bacterium]|nr:biotin/lipoyl-containing protein [Tissierellia bacterium]
MAKRFNIIVNGTEYDVEVEEIKEEGAGQEVSRPTPAPRRAPAAPKAAPKQAAAPAGGAGSVTAPMPGTINDIKVTEGQDVKKGDVLLILEAMKMENEIKAPADGKVTSIPVTKGASVNTGDTLVTLS